MAKQIRKLNVAMIGYGFMGRALLGLIAQRANVFAVPCRSLHISEVWGRGTQYLGDQP